MKWKKYRVHTVITGYSWGVADRASRTMSPEPKKSSLLVDSEIHPIQELAKSNDSGETASRSCEAVCTAVLLRACTLQDRGNSFQDRSSHGRGDGERAGGA